MIELITATYKYSDRSPIKQHSHLPNKTQNANFESYLTLIFLSAGFQEFLSTVLQIFLYLLPPITIANSTITSTPNFIALTSVSSYKSKNICYLLHQLLFFFAIPISFYQFFLRVLRPAYLKDYHYVWVMRSGPPNR